MKPFESYLATRLEAYIHFRLAQGYQEEPTRGHLLIFDRYLLEQGYREHPVEPSFLLRMRDSLKQDARTVNRLLSALRGFFMFLRRQEVYEENPMQDIPPLPERLYLPFVFDPAQIEQLLQAASNSVRKDKGKFLLDLGAYVAVTLQARCGMRIREPLRLRCKHYRQSEGTLYIEKTKFKKDRLIPVPKAALREIESYRAARRVLLSVDDNPYLIAGVNQSRLPETRVYRVFYNAVRHMGIQRKTQAMADVVFASPRPHCLRHSFAVNTLKRIREQGKSPQHALPVLAAYMGHAKYQYTSAYLKVLDADNLQGLIDFAQSRLDLV